MKSRWFAKIAAIVCAICLAMGVMCQTVFARDDASDEREHFAELPEATFLVVGADPEETSPTPAAVDNGQSLPLYTGEERVGHCTMIDGEPYVAVVDLLKALGLQGEVLDYGSALSLSVQGVMLSAQEGQPWLVCNDRYFYLAGGPKNLDGALALPVELLVKCLGVTAYWDRDLWRVTITNINVTPLEAGSSFYNDSDVYWLGRMICAMADGQSLETKIAVGNVCVNRMNSDAFPGQNSIYDVVFAKNQFSIVTNGMIYNEPEETELLAAKLALEGCDLTEGAVYMSNGDLGPGYRLTARYGDLAFYTKT